MDWRVFRDIAGRGWALLAALFAIGVLGALTALEGELTGVMILLTLGPTALLSAKGDPIFRERIRGCFPASSVELGRTQWLALVGAPILIGAMGTLLGAIILRVSRIAPPDARAVPWGFLIGFPAGMSALLLLNRLPGGIRDMKGQNPQRLRAALARLWCVSSILWFLYCDRLTGHPTWIRSVGMANALALGIVSYYLSVGVPVGLDGKWILGGGARGGARGAASPRRKHLGERMEDAAIESARPLGKRASWALTAAMMDLYVYVFAIVTLTAILRIIRAVGFISASDPINFPVELVAAFLAAAPILRWHPALRVLGTLPISRARLTWGIAFGCLPIYAMILAPAIWALGGLEPGSAYSISARLPIAIVVGAVIPTGIAGTLKWEPSRGFVVAIIALLPPFVLGILRSLSVLQFSALHLALLYGSILYLASVLWLRAVILGWNDSYQRNHPPFMAMDFLNPRPGR